MNIRESMRRLGILLSVCGGILGGCFATPSAAQTVIGSARLMCGTGNAWETSGPIVGAIINQTSISITDLEIELSIMTRDKKGTLKRKRDARLVVVPSLNQDGMLTSVKPNGDVYFSIPGKGRGLFDRKCCPDSSDLTCATLTGSGNEVLNVAAIAITRINGKSLLTGGNGVKQAPLASMLQVPRYTPEHAPTEREVIQAIREQNALFHSTIINKQLKDCLSRGTWACTFNNNTNINVVISQQ